MFSPKFKCIIRWLLQVIIPFLSQLLLYVCTSNTLPMQSKHFLKQTWTNLHFTKVFFIFSRSISWAQAAQDQSISHQLFKLSVSKEHRGHHYLCQTGMKWPTNRITNGQREKYLMQWLCQGGCVKFSEMCRVLSLNTYWVCVLDASKI